MTLELIRSPLLAELPGVAHGFTTRRHGASKGIFSSLNLSGRVGDEKQAVDRNRSALLAALGRPEGALIAVKQVHGDLVVEVTSAASRTIEADGLVTRDRDAVVAVLVADCVPILIASRDGAAVAAVHAGWRGTRARIAARAVERLGASGFAPDTLTVALGPAIGPCCFEIGAEVETELRAAYPNAGEALRQHEDGRRVADLWGLNRLALVEAGVRPERIDVLARCVSCEEQEFFSHRRDKGETGRQAGAIAPRR